MLGGEPTAQSLAFRSNLAQLVSGLQRVRSRAPFFQLAAHRIPTLWSLYRGLLRAVPTEHIKFRVRAVFRRNQHLTGLERTKRNLELGYKWLGFFQKAQSGDDNCQKVLERYSRLIAERRAKADLNRLLKGELENQLHLRTRPIYTGGFLRPTINNGPLPRMSPQPQHISMLIRNRVKAKSRRTDTQFDLKEALHHLDIETQFERDLLQKHPDAFEACFSSEMANDEWLQPIQTSLDEIAMKDERDSERAKTPFSLEMVQNIVEARREKIRNKTREMERERRGELTMSALRRQRKGPPAHVLSLMSPKRREMDRISRSRVEVGYTALVKHRLGFKLRDPATALEIGKKENQGLLDRARDMIWKENNRRMQEEDKLWAEQKATKLS